MKRSLFTIIFLFLVISSNYATTYYVSKAGDDSNNGLSWATAKLTIGSAISAASTGDSVFVSVGNFAGFNVKNNVHVFGGFAGTEISLQQRQSINYGFLTNGLCTKIDQPVTNYINMQNLKTKVYFLESANTKTYIDGFVFSGNSISYIPIWLSGKYMLKNCYISDSSSSGYSVLVDGGDVSFENVKFEKCRGVSLYIQNSGSVNINNCVFKGGEKAISSINSRSGISTVVNMTNCLIINNKVNNNLGYGIVTSSSTSNGGQSVINIVDSRFFNNLNSGESGSNYSTSIIKTNRSTLRMLNCLVCVIVHNVIVENSYFHVANL